MTAFSYSSGNPADLTAGGGAEMIDIQGPLNDVKAFLNGGTMDETNVPNLSAAFTTWKTTGFMGAGSAVSQGAATFIVPGGSTLNGSSIALPSVANTSMYTFYIDPADWIANTRTTKLRIRWQLVVNGVAPAINFTPGMYPAATGAPGGGTIPHVSFGTVVAGSTVTYTAPALGTDNVSVSSEFNCPAAGRYAFGVVLSGLMAANSAVALLASLQMRQV